jgi:hypothetical protein
MSRFAQILIPAGDAPVVVNSLGGGASSSALNIGVKRVFAINADQDICIAFGKSTVSAPTQALNYRIPANQQTTLDTGASGGYVRCLNLSASSSANIYIMLLEGR